MSQTTTCEACGVSKTTHAFPYPPQNWLRVTWWTAKTPLSATTEHEAIACSWGCLKTIAESMAEYSEESAS